MEQPILSSYSGRRGGIGSVDRVRYVALIYYSEDRLNLKSEFLCRSELEKRGTGTNIPGVAMVRSRQITIVPFCGCQANGGSLFRAFHLNNVTRCKIWVTARVIITSQAKRKAGGIATSDVAEDWSNLTNRSSWAIQWNNLM